MQTVDSLLGGALLIAPPRFHDPRGTFTVPFESDAAAELGLPERFVQDNHSVSYRAGTIRGVHIQLPPHEQGKLVRVLRGRIFDLVVDLRPDSGTVGQVATVELSAEGGEMLWVPRGLGHAFCTLEPDTEVFYKVDRPYRPDAELSVAWDDPALGVEWPVAADRAVVSHKDKHGVKLIEALALFRAATQEADRDRHGRPVFGSQSADRPADWMGVDTVGGKRMSG